MKILITGAKGQLGQKLAQVLGQDHELVLTDREEMDITHAQKTAATILGAKPDVIIHAAAYIDVDGAEDETQLCRRVNVAGSANVAQAATRVGATIVYISTDYVFDGHKKSPYREDDMTNPISVYGQSKLDGEKEIAKYCDKHYILRVSWLFGENRTNKNFVETMLTLARQGVPLKIINDQIGSPTYTGDVVEVIRRIIKNQSANYGVYHFSGIGETTRFEFTNEIFRQKQIKASIKPIATNQFPAKAKRPAYSYLCKLKIETALNIKVKTWQKMLENYLKIR